MFKRDLYWGAGENDSQSPPRLPLAVLVTHVPPLVDEGQGPVRGGLGGGHQGPHAVHPTVRGRLTPPHRRAT